jgi:hydroxyethylthiazole kinase-like uncharacterized protein yjeF
VTQPSSDAGYPPLPHRPRDGHKGTFGRVLIIGGCCDGLTRMLGAPALAALAALRSGVGLVTIAAPAPLLAEMLTICPSATGVALPCDGSGALVPHECVRVLDASGTLARADAVVVGPGLGVGDGTRALTLRAIQQTSAPVVVDADALNTLAETIDFAKDMKAACVLTPHPGEYRRLARALDLDAEPITPEDRSHAADAMARRLGCIIVLKGAGTVVSDGLSSWTSPHAHACLATAGTGDVLAGLLGGLLAQHVAMHASPRVDELPHDLVALAAQRLRERGSALVSQTLQPVPPPAHHARLAIGTLRGLVCASVTAHALAGEAWSRSRGADAGMLAAELADELPAILSRMRARP